MDLSFLKPKVWGHSVLRYAHSAQMVSNGDQQILFLSCKFPFVIISIWICCSQHYQG